MTETQRAPPEDLVRVVQGPWRGVEIPIAERVRLIDRPCDVIMFEWTTHVEAQTPPRRARLATADVGPAPALAKVMADDLLDPETQNAHVESFNGRFRDECLAQARFPTLARARAEIEIWRVDYNTERPHSALDYRTPKAFGDLVRCKVRLRRRLPPPSVEASRRVILAIESARE